MAASETVRVIVRCRPMNQREIDLKCQNVISMDAKINQVVLENIEQTNEPPKQFTFDGVYAEDSITENLYAESVFPLVESVLEGYNGTVFAYGQTGCGKSFTMQGLNAPGSPQRGVIPRSFEHIFEASAVAAGTKYLIRASYLEIYNESIRDLLGKDVKATLDIKEYVDKGVQVHNLTWHQCSNVVDCERLMDKGNRNRATGATLMNKDSSRSHSIFTIVTEMCTRSALDGKEHIRAGKLNLVDLAGSERQSKTHAEGERLREATRINLSLSALGNVISALVDSRSKHIPYRDSKLTRLLQDSLGGNTKTLMVAAISPAHDNYDETLSTLRYANRAKNIKNKPRINEDPRDAQMKLLQEEINRLKQELLNAGNPPARPNQTLPPPEQTSKADREEELERERERLRADFEREVSEIRRQYETERLTKEEIQRKYDELKTQYDTDLETLTTAAGDGTGDTDDRVDDAGNTNGRVGNNGRTGGRIGGRTGGRTSDTNRRAGGRTGGTDGRADVRADNYIGDADDTDGRIKGDGDINDRTGGRTGVANGRGGGAGSRAGGRVGGTDDRIDDNAGDADDTDGRVDGDRVMNDRIGGRIGGRTDVANSRVGGPGSRVGGTDGRIDDNVGDADDTDGRIDGDRAMNDRTGGHSGGHTGVANGRGGGRVGGPGGRVGGTDGRIDDNVGDADDTDGRVDGDRAMNDRTGGRTGGRTGVANGRGGGRVGGPGGRVGGTDGRIDDNVGDADDTDGRIDGDRAMNDRTGGRSGGRTGVANDRVGGRAGGPGGRVGGTDGRIDDNVGDADDRVDGDRAMNDRTGGRTGGRTGVANDRVGGRANGPGGRVGGTDGRIDDNVGDADDTDGRVDGNRAMNDSTGGRTGGRTGVADGRARGRVGGPSGRVGGTDGHVGGPSGRVGGTDGHVGGNEGHVGDADDTDGRVDGDINDRTGGRTSGRTGVAGGRTGVAGGRVGGTDGHVGGNEGYVGDADDTEGRVDGDINDGTGGRTGGRTGVVGGRVGGAGGQVGGNEGHVGDVDHTDGRVDGDINDRTGGRTGVAGSRAGGRAVGGDSLAVDADGTGGADNLDGDTDVRTNGATGGRGRGRARNANGTANLDGGTDDAGGRARSGVGGVNNINQDREEGNPAASVDNGPTKGKKKRGNARQKRGLEGGNNDEEINRENIPVGADSTEQKRKLQRLLELENKLIGGEDVNNEEQKKKRKKKLNEMKEKQEQRKRFHTAINGDDDDALMKVFDNAQDQLHYTLKKLDEQRAENRRLQSDNDDLQREFQREREEYLNTIREQEKRLLLYRTMIEKMSRLMPQNSNYSNVDRVIDQARYDEDKNLYYLPDPTREDVQLPQMGHQPVAPNTRIKSSSHRTPTKSHSVLSTTGYEDDFVVSNENPPTNYEEMDRSFERYHDDNEKRSERHHDDNDKRYDQHRELADRPRIKRQEQLLNESSLLQRVKRPLSTNDNDYMNRRLNFYDAPARLSRKYGFPSDKQ